MDAIDYAAIGARIRRRRVEMGLTQEQLAERAAISTSFIGHLERAEKVPSLETVARLCDALDVDADYLLRGRRNRCDRQGCALYDELAGLLRRFGKE